MSMKMVTGVRSASSVSHENQVNALGSKDMFLKNQLLRNCKVEDFNHE